MKRSMMAPEAFPNLFCFSMSLRLESLPTKSEFICWELRAESYRQVNEPVNVDMQRPSELMERCRWFVTGLFIPSRGVLRRRDLSPHQRQSRLPPEHRGSPLPLSREQPPQKSLRQSDCMKNTAEGYENPDP